MRRRSGATEAQGSTGEFKARVKGEGTYPTLILRPVRVCGKQKPHHYLRRLVLRGVVQRQVSILRTLDTGRIEKRKREDYSVISARLEARTGLGASRACTELHSLAPFGCESSSALTVASEAWFVAAWCSGKGLSCARRHGRVIYSPNQRNRTVETVYATNPHLITTAD